jgi:hypothetical protein
MFYVSNFGNKLHFLLLLPFKLLTNLHSILHLKKFHKRVHLDFNLDGCIVGKSSELETTDLIDVMDKFSGIDFFVGVTEESIMHNSYTVQFILSQARHLCTQFARCTVMLHYDTNMLH